MRKYFSFGLLVVLSQCIYAQSIRVPAGKKFQLITNTTTTTGVTVMGQSIDNVMDMKMLQDYTVQSIDPDGYTYSVITKKISGKISVMGQEHNFDSDDEAARNNPGMAMLGKEQQIKVQNGIAIVSDDMKNMFSTFGFPGDNLSGVNKLFISEPVESLKNGYSWADSANSGGVSIVNKYFVTAVTGEQVEVRVSSETKTHTTLKQGGMEMQSDMKGFATATRTYDKKTGLLIGEKLASEMAGTGEAMGVKAPITIKVVSESTVQ